MNYATITYGKQKTNTGLGNNGITPNHNQSHHAIVANEKVMTYANIFNNRLVLNHIFYISWMSSLDPLIDIAGQWLGQ